MKKTVESANFFYRNFFGRFLLKIIMKLHLDKPAVWFLRSGLSKGFIKRFVKKNNIPLPMEEVASFRTYRDFFVRTREDVPMDMTDSHLMSPCDSLLSAFKIDENSRFAIKGSLYGVDDFLKDKELAKNYKDGLCLVFRLCASDYHHYCYIDEGSQGENHPIPGVLHSVQPIACEKYPVYVLNKRSWCLMNTKNFGPVVECEIGALIVGGIANEKENASFKRGEEKGHFELAGSTIVLLFEKDRIEFNPEIVEQFSHTEEVRVKQGEWIAVCKHVSA